MPRLVELFGFASVSDPSDPMLLEYKFRYMLEDAGSDFNTLDA